jgi:hypothetical protein
VAEHEAEDKPSKSQERRRKEVLREAARGYGTDFVRMLLGGDPRSEKALKKRRELLLDMIFASLGCRRP